MLRFFSYFLIPGITVLMPGRSRWLESNFSVVGSRTPGRLALILWGIVTGWFFHFFLIRVLNQAKFFFSVRKELRLTNLSAVLLLLSVLTPYLPEQFPFISAAHVASAFAASVLLYLILCSLTVKMYSLDPNEFRLLAGVLVSVPPVCAAFFILAGNIISSAMEIYFIILCSLCLSRLAQKIERLLRTRA